MTSKRLKRRGSRMTTVTVSPEFQVVIPQVIRDAMGIRPGQRIHAMQHRDRIELIPLRPMHKVRQSLEGVGTSVSESKATRNAQGGPYVPRTALGRSLVELRNKGIRSGMKLLTACEINEELARRRGEGSQC